MVIESDFQTLFIGISMGLGHTRERLYLVNYSI